MEFVEEPPSEALLGDLLGVGLLAVVDGFPEEGLLPDDAFDEVLGAAPRHYVLFFDRENENAEEAL